MKFRHTSKRVSAVSGMNHNKRGSLNLSINAIVVLILAITMLSLGLAFMKGLFKKTTGQLEQVGTDIKNQMIEQLRTSSDKLTLNQEDIEIARGEKIEIYYGIKNVEMDNNAFTIGVSCTEALGDAVPLSVNAGDIEIFSESRSLEKGEIDVQKMIITIPSQADPTTHSCMLSLTRGADEYAKKSFFVTVKS